MQFNILKNQSNFIKDKDPGPFSKNNGFIYNMELDGTYFKGFKVEEVNCNKAGIAHEANKLDIGWIVLATGSTGTHAGLLAGLHAAGSQIPIMGISVRQPKDKQIAAVYKLTKSTAARITEKEIGVEKVIVDDGYVGAGYGQPNQGTLDAINLIARNEVVSVTRVDESSIIDNSNIGTAHFKMSYTMSFYGNNISDRKGIEATSSLGRPRHRCW